MKFAIITDGNNQLGMGHVYQSTTLARTIMNEVENAEIFFLTKSSSSVTDLICQNGFEAKAFTTDNLIFNWLEDAKPDRIIFDKLDVSPELAQRIQSELNVKLIIFTNLTSANDYADITVLADIGSHFENIYDRDEITGKVEFFGPKYWLLRPEFYDRTKTISVDHFTIKNIMLMFGGADPLNISTGVLDELLRMNRAFNITLVLGDAFNNHDELDEVRSLHLNSTSKVDVVEKINNVAERMFENDLVFASPGLSFFESLAIGTPVIGFHQNDLQRDVYKGFLDTYDKSEVYKVPDLIENKNFIFPETPNIKKMEIGKGKREILAEIVKPKKRIL
ncbi:spore coat polysaccharide biosynthesis predicted glycosyltransferase SpsG [Roseivirga ehrenbergii]|uniref:UDP-2,4-diacetamido-2,4, 6-trideoxy-beta-L-altropyranose hydrolase n=1 Tax=Roseivirga ehrenbergii (strain DSM 102268 / JCM 13514 / KCTC 12282 / NCIMB 14502 / KMM 6017) TaxID=279360 RepID=A0A150XE88_ROSEK|nr:hypothetical protein [Roseivirga ehrenbergii]KYG77045.1 hypothetical protein MB14_02255 [Roseivirga ehrenbergii]TCL14452.1 spore coat polysaccharide biosynthesis predicted glycosyltransferase SpsG [Roseivirga ehrenbergii]